MKIFTNNQLKEFDRLTIEREPISSIDLMERASVAIAEVLVRRWPDTNTPFMVFAGSGNNGGDALAVSRLLAEKGYSVEVFLFNIKKTLSAECEENWNRLENKENIKRHEIVTEFNPPTFVPGTIIIDGLFGTGLNHPLLKGYAGLVHFINGLPGVRVAIDVPSGLFGEDNSQNIRTNIIKADLTLTIQCPKLAFFFAENEEFVGDVEVLDIGIDKRAMDQTASIYRTIDEREVAGILKPISKFAHKGTRGHALIIAGSYGMAGASVLATKACLKAGAGKVTAHTPTLNNTIMQIAIPEAIIHHDASNSVFSSSVPMIGYNAVGIGPGIGTNPSTVSALQDQLDNLRTPLVLDADAINILSTHKAWIQDLPKGTILTPHPKEMDKLVGPCETTYKRMMKAMEMAQQFGIYFVLKGKWSIIVCPDGTFLLNPTGNPGMATAGSGDVLTGILTSLLAQGYSSLDTVRLGVYLHGLAGDFAAEELGEESVIASDIINNIPKAFKKLKNK